jgi:hypothetical protein
MRKLLVAFGDSWTFGSELDKPQRDAWPRLVANKMEAELLNLATPASSIGHLSVQLFDFFDQYPDYKEYRVIFMVGLTSQSRCLSYCNQIDEFVNITPDAVHRTGDIKPTGQPPMDLEQLRSIRDSYYRYIDHKNYSKFLATQVVFLFQQFTNHNYIDAIFFSYFDQLNLDQYFIDKRTILPETITKLITGQDYAVPDIRDNFYFKHKLFHPNEHGHQAIADLLLDFYEKNYGN